MSLPCRGLVIGKFRVPHAGHDHLIRVATLECEHLLVLVMVRPSDPVPGLMRQTWLSAAHPAATVRLVPHDLPTDYTDPETWRRWISLISANLDAPVDVVFSSEPYGDELARRLNSVHRMVDVDRAAVAISATAILASPQAHARFIAPEVLTYLCS